MAQSRHSGLEPSNWVVRALDRLAIPVDLSGRLALDLACGGGRHSELLASRGIHVLAVDKVVPDTQGWSELVQFQQMDLEGEVWPLQGQKFDLIVVTNYLHRARFKDMLANLKPGGALVYETFMQGNERFGSPRNPAFLLEPNELIELCNGLHVLAFEQGARGEPATAVIQRILAVSGDWSEIQSQSNLNQ